MSTEAYGPWGRPRPVPASPDDSPKRRPWAGAVTGAVWALADFAAFTLMLLHLVSRYQHEHHSVGTNVGFLLGSDVVSPLVGWVWFLILLNGLGLCVRSRTRAAGVGLLVAAATIAIPVIVWVVVTLATF
jgi:hypothetical protein